MELLRTEDDISGRIESRPVSLQQGLKLLDVVDFVYVRQNIPGPGIPISKFETEFEGCDCPLLNTCDSTCVCIHRFGQAYDTKGCLVQVNPYSQKMRPIYECNKYCKCAKTCMNRVVQKGIMYPLEIFNAGRKGYGLQAKEAIPKNAFVCEYAGEIISKDVGQQRTSQRAKGEPNYILVVREHSAEGEIRTFVDPTFIGNCGRFINHSCEPNLYMVPVRVSCEIPRLALFAIRDIATGEELSYDYSGNVQKTSPTSVSSGGTPQLDFDTETETLSVEMKTPDDTSQSSGDEKGHDSEIESDRPKCYCTSQNCRGVLPFDTSLYA